MARKILEFVVFVALWVGCVSLLAHFKAGATLGFFCGFLFSCGYDVYKECTK